MSADDRRIPELLTLAAEELARSPEGSEIAETKYDGLQGVAWPDAGASTQLIGRYLAPKPDRNARSRLVAAKHSAATQTIEGPAGVSRR